MARVFNVFTGTFDEIGDPVTGLQVDGSGNMYLGGSAGQASALLALNSTTKGWLSPVMTSAQRTAIVSPAQGLKVYQTDGGTAEGDWVYRAGAWWQNLVVNSSGATPGGLTVSGALGVTGAATFSNGLIANSVTSGGGGSQAFGITAGSTTLSGTTTAAAGLGRGVIISNTLNAAANNDVLVGLDINPTFNNGAFGPVTQYALRVLTGNSYFGGNVQLGNGLTLSSNGFLISGVGVFSADTGNTYLAGRNPTSNVNFVINNTTVGRFNGTTGNLTLQNGGTFTDAGYRLDVQGTTRLAGDVTIDTGGGTNTLRLRDGNISKTAGGGFNFQSGLYANNLASGGRLYISTGASASAVTPTAISALVQFDSTSLGVLFPAQLQSQRTAITTPAQGLLVYQTDGSSAEGLYVYRGGSWNQFATLDASGNLPNISTITAPQNFSVGGSFSVATVSATRMYMSNDTSRNLSAAGLNDSKIVVANYTNTDSGTAGGSTSDVAAVYFGIPTFRAVNNQTYINAATLVIGGPPTLSNTAGGTISNTSLYSIKVVTGDSYFGGRFLKVGSTGNAGQVQFARGGDGAYTASIGFSSANVNDGDFRIYSGGGGATITLDANGPRAKVMNSGNFIVQPASGTITDVASAAFQIVSTTQGFLGPNMTQAQRTAITAVQGLRVYQTDGGTAEGDWVYRGGAWCQNVTYLAGTNNISTSGTLTVSGGITTYNPLTAIAFYATSTSNTNPSTVGTIIKINGMTHNDYNTAASGTVPHVAVSGIGRPTLAAGNTGISYTNASTLYLEGAPISGTNVSITNPYTLFINQGSSYFGGFVNVGANFQANQIYSPNNIQATGSMTATGGIGANISSFHASAIMQADSTTKGFLTPRMTAAQLGAISSPAQGLKVYQTDGGTAEGDWVYRAGAWWQTLVVNGSGATPGALTVSGNLTATTYTLTQPTAISSTATTLVNLNNGDIFQINLGSNISVLNVYNARVGTFILKFTQDATGSRTVAWPAAWKWSGATAPTITATAGKTDIISLVYDGTNWYASILQNF